MGLTHLLGILSSDLVGSETHFHGLRLASAASYALGSTSSRDRTDRDLRLSKLGLVPSVNDVTHECQLTATSQLHPEKNNIRFVAKMFFYF